MQKGKKGLKRKNHNTVLRCAAFAMFWFLLATSACSNRAESPKKSEPVKQAAATPAVKKTDGAAKQPSSATEASAQTVAVEFTYDPAGKPDPFIPLISEAAITSQKADVQAAPEAADLAPLQKYDLSELNLVAIIIRDDNSSTAMVEDKAGYGYILKQGMLIGKNNGIIRHITPNTIVVEEKIVDPSGSEKNNTVTLSVTKTQSGEE
jgi:type IV pilus assembly protein PilP